MRVGCEAIQPFNYMRRILLCLPGKFDSVPEVLYQPISKFKYHRYPRMIFVLNILW